MLQIRNVTIDCADPSRLARFWVAALGLEALRSDDDCALLGQPSHPGPRLFLQRVPEPKATKNRAHLDLDADDRRAEVERLVTLGAREAETHREGALTWTVLADPEGNEFCVVGET